MYKAVLPSQTSFCWGFYVAGLMAEERKGSCGKIGIKGVGSGGLGGRAFSGVCKKLILKFRDTTFCKQAGKAAGVSNLES